MLLTYPQPLRKCKFLKRYKRFFVDVSLDDKNGIIDTVHCPNSGSMKTCLFDGADAYTLDSCNPERKLRHTLELMDLPDGLACLNTGRANQFIEKILNETIGVKRKDFFLKANFPYEHFEKYHFIKREAKYNADTRFDFCLTSPNSQKKCWIEVKSVSLKWDEMTYAFPDAVTQRGQKHLLHLMEAKQQGDDAWLFFVIMRGTNILENELVQSFRVCHEIDAQYAQLFEQAKKVGVGIAIVIPQISLNGFSLRKIHLMQK